MDESNATRAIMIGAATLIAIATISAVLTYYNTAREMVQSIGSGYDFDANYSEYVKDILLRTDKNSKITGTDVINIMNYFYDDATVEVNLKNIVEIGFSYDSEGSGNSITKKQASKINLNESEFEKFRKIINPNAHFRLTSKNQDYKLIIDLEQINS